MRENSFLKKVDLRSRQSMEDFLESHFRYYTMMNGLHARSSYAHNIKIYNLGLSQELEDRLYGLIQCDSAYDNVNDLIDQFDETHGYRWQAGINGRNGGYLVLYEGGIKPTEYKSRCMYCGQLNFTKVSETGKKCGRCGREGRIDLDKPIMQTFTYPGRGVDMDADFSDWNIETLRERVRLIQEFDQLAEDIADEAEYFATNYRAEEEEIFVPQTVMSITHD